MPRGALQFDMKQFSARLRVLERHTGRAKGRALVDVAEQVIGGAQQRCPVLTGALQASGTVEESDAAGGEVRVGFNTDYAAAVHERTEAAHPQGEARFLTNEIREALPRINRELGERIAREALR